MQQSTKSWSVTSLKEMYAFFSCTSVALMEDINTARELSSSTRCNFCFFLDLKENLTLFSLCTAREGGEDDRGIAIV